ncbi:MAG: GNAT family N-acetyltransferase [Burkholderiales bacterium]|jgi:GNAT superfamily N-acetyltransferase|nr:GNAT family N-acetyltransferase [Burkholderiales bacterium]
MPQAVPSPSFTIAPATPQDIPELVTMLRALAEYEKLRDQCISTESDFQRALFGPEREAEALIARVGDKAAGYALFCYNFSTFLARRGLWLEDLFVYPQYRGLGIGKAMLIRLARTAHELGYGRFEWAVLDWNTPAIEFYKAMGATVMDDWRIVRVTGDALKQLAEQ